MERELPLLRFTFLLQPKPDGECSRAIAGVLTADVLDGKRDVNGSTLLEAARAAGYQHESHASMLQGARILPPRVAAFVELHIEQGPLLEEEGTPVGVVTAIAAPAALRVSFSGTGGHAGGLLMPYRCDTILSLLPFQFQLCKNNVHDSFICTLLSVAGTTFSPS